MSERVEPAMTPEEWGEALDHRYGLQDYVVRPAEAIGYGEDGPGDLHRVAALCLHGQRFGFTHEDVDLLRELARAAEAERDNLPGGVDHVLYERQEWAESLADRIEALLPPRERECNCSGPPDPTKPPHCPRHDREQS